MVAYTTLLAATATLFAAASAAPQLKARHTGIVHRIFAGATTENGGLHFEPQNVVAEIGDYVEFHFLPKNHTVVQSSFEKPCEPLAGGVFSGFNFATAQGESKSVFTIQVQNKDPFWYYCSQINGDHCQRGMSGVINQNFNSNEKTLAKYKEAAKNTKTVQPSADITASNGGAILPNTFLG
jgi:plastocyanin